MKYLVYILFLVSSYCASQTLSQEGITVDNTITLENSFVPVLPAFKPLKDHIKSFEISKDTLFVYKVQYRWNMDFDGENVRDVYISKGDSIIFLKTEKPKIVEILVKEYIEKW